MTWAVRRRYPHPPRRMRVGTIHRQDRRVRAWCATLARAVRANGFRGSPGLGGIKNSARSAPLGPKRRLQRHAGASVPSPGQPAPLPPRLKPPGRLAPGWVSTPQGRPRHGRPRVAGAALLRAPRVGQPVQIRRELLDRRVSAIVSPYLRFRCWSAMRRSWTSSRRSGLNSMLSR